MLRYHTRHAIIPRSWSISTTVTTTGYSPAQLMFGGSVDHRQVLFPDISTPPAAVSDTIRDMLLSQGIGLYQPQLTSIRTLLALLLTKSSSSCSSVNSGASRSRIGGWIFPHWLSKPQCVSAVQGLDIIKYNLFTHSHI